MTFNETDFDLGKSEAESTEVVNVDTESSKSEKEPGNEQ